MNTSVSKKDLVAFAFDSALDGGLAVFERITAERGLCAALSAYINGYITRLDHKNGPVRGSPLPVLAADLRWLSDGLRTQDADGVRRLVTRLRHLLESAAVADAETRASPVRAEVVGAISLARALPDAGEAALFLLRSRKALVVRLGMETLA